MSKELEALKTIKDYAYVDDWDGLHLLKEDHKEELGIIEKALKALEIIRNKRVNIPCLIKFKTLHNYNCLVDKGFDAYSKELTESEYKIIWEVLFNEQR